VTVEPVSEPQIRAQYFSKVQEVACVIRGFRSAALQPDVVQTASELTARDITRAPSRNGCDEQSFAALLTASAHLGASDPRGLRPMDPWPTLWAAVDYRGATGAARNS